MRGSWFAFWRTRAAWSKVRAAKRAGNFVKVLEDGEKVLAHNPWDAKVQLEMGDAADALELHDLAVWFLEQARMKNLKDPVINRHLARYYEKRGNFTQAIMLWDLIRKIDPRDTEAVTKSKDLAASDTISRGGYDSLVAQAQEAAALEAMTPQPVVREPSPIVVADRQEQEMKLLRSRIRADPRNANNYLQLAGIFRRAGKLDLARDLLEHALGPTGNHFDLTTQLAEMDIEPFHRNLAIVEEKLRSDAGNDELRALRIKLLKEINTRELELFRLKSDRYPAEKGFRFELGVRLLRAGQVEEAIRELQAVRNDPRHYWRALLYLGHCFKGRNNWRLAQRNFEEALQNLPPGEETSRKEILFQLAQGHADAGDLTRAIELGYELANIDFGYHDIGRLLDEWQARQLDTNAPLPGPTGP
jgi:tetratricopeptide (TPR) repeat protein